MEINAGSYVYPASSLTYKNENPLSTYHPIYHLSPSDIETIMFILFKEV